MYAHRELVAIIGEYDRKRPILLEASACLAQLFVFAKNRMLSQPSESAQEDAAILVRTFGKCTTLDSMRIALNLLVALQILIRLPKAFYARLSNTIRSQRTGQVQYTQPDKAFESRILVLQHLHTREALENKLDTASKTAQDEINRCEKQLRTLSALEELPNPSGGPPKIRLIAPEGDTSDPLSTAARILELIERHTIASHITRISRWFKHRMDYAVLAGWNVAVLWQNDGKKAMLSVQKE